MKAFVLEKQEMLFLEEITKYELALAKNKTEMEKYRALGAYEIFKKQLVETFGFYLPFADSSNIKISKTQEGFAFDFSLKKETQEQQGLSAFWIYVKRVLIAFDQMGNTLFRGDEDESLFSRFYRWSLKDGVLWKIPAYIVNAFLFFDYRIDEDGKKMFHCEKEFDNELRRTGLLAGMR